MVSSPRPLAPQALLPPPLSLGPISIQHLTGFASPVKYLLVSQRKLRADGASSVFALCKRLAGQRKFEYRSADARIFLRLHPHPARNHWVGEPSTPCRSFELTLALPLKHFPVTLTNQSLLPNTWLFRNDTHRLDKER